VSFRHVDQYAAVVSPVTRTVPTARLLGTVTLAAGSAALPFGAWMPLAVLFLAVMLIGRAARVPVRQLLIRTAGPFVLVLLASAGLLVLVPGEPLFTLGVLKVSSQGLERFAFVLGRASVALGAAVILVSTTSFPELLHAFRELRLPHVVTASLGVGYRLLYILVDELERLQRAARSRNAGAGVTTRRRLLVGITAAGLSRAFSRGERTHRAMLARGYAGDVPALFSQSWDRRSTLVLAMLVLLVGVVLGGAHILP
jgi:cobalt/nickel transport system permease protein